MQNFSNISSPFVGLVLVFFTVCWYSQTGVAQDANAKAQNRKGSPAMSGTPSGDWPMVASVTLGHKIEENRMRLVNQDGDGASMATEVGGVACHLITSEPGLPPTYIYFQLNSALRLQRAPVLIAVEYFDATTGSITIDYDSFDEKSRNPAYTRIPTRVELRNDKRWHKAAFLVEYPRFQQGMHDGGDFRLALSGGGRLFVRAAQVMQERVLEK